MFSFESASWGPGTTRPSSTPPGSVEGRWIRPGRRPVAAAPERRPAYRAAEVRVLGGVGAAGAASGGDERPRSTEPEPTVATGLGDPAKGRGVVPDRDPAGESRNPTRRRIATSVAAAPTNLGPDDRTGQQNGTPT